jgi:hypothetical protein
MVSGFATATWFIFGTGKLREMAWPLCKTRYCTAPLRLRTSTPTMIAVMPMTR